ncbi:MAG: hypothetical protein V1914_03260 [archaeon]
MHHVKTLLEEAQERMLRADHLAFTTYPQLQEPKLLALIVENTNIVFLKCMDALLYHERMYKRINPVKGDFDSEMRVLKGHCFKRFGFPDSVAQMIVEVKSLAEKKQDCSMEFARKDQYVLCSDRYKMDFLNIRNVRGYVDGARKFLGHTLEVLR